MLKMAALSGKLPTKESADSSGAEPPEGTKSSGKDYDHDCAPRSVVARPSLVGDDLHALQLKTAMGSVPT